MAAVIGICKKVFIVISINENIRIMFNISCIVTRH